MIHAVTDPAILEGYLRDASNLRGTAEMLFRPRTTTEVSEVVRWCQDQAVPLTVTAKRTSTTGAPVPMGGALLSTEFLNTIHDDHDVDGGAFLGAYQSHIEGHKLFFPPDPTSRHECSVGGAIACNASGARTYKYGPTRPWIEAAEVVLADGSVQWVDRTTPAPWIVPHWDEPSVKTAAGLFPANNLLDLVIGSEGLLGIVTRARTKLIPLPAAVLTFLAFFPSRSGMLAFIEAARALGPRCIEHFDRNSLELIRGKLPDVPAAYAALLVEVEHEGEAPLEAWFDLLVRHEALVDETVVAEDDSGRAKLQSVRHALPAAVNEIISRNGVQKVGTDFAVPWPRFPEMLDQYESVPMASVCFGHIGDAHLHLNLLPKNADELASARAIYFELAQAAVAMGGTVSAEHGIGRLKVKHLALMAPPEVLGGWRALKRAADPNWILGRGVMFSPG